GVRGTRREPPRRRSFGPQESGGRGSRPAEGTREVDPHLRLRLGRVGPQGKECRGPRDPAAGDRGVRDEQAEGTRPRAGLRLLHRRGASHACDREAPRRRPRAARQDAPAGPAHRGSDEPDHRDAEHGPRAEPRQTDLPRSPRHKGHASEDLAENLDAVMRRLVGKLERGRFHIRSAYLKTTKGPAGKYLWGGVDG